ncbi:MAG: glycosyltransferase [Chloroflexota bacterium]|nr:glycosyltransferase [Chloroflexota bacterium]
MPRSARPPPEIRRLLNERTEARAASDWDRADTLRDEIAALGWEVQDGFLGSTARPSLPSGPLDDVASTLESPATVSASVQVVADEHLDDLRRLMAGLATHSPSVPWELVLVANAPSFDVDALASMIPEVPSSVIRTTERLGWADSRNLGMRRSNGAVTVLIDTSIEPTGDFLATLLATFDADPTIGLAGPWGVRSADGRQFHDAPPGEVDAVEGYCLAVRREALRAVGGFDRRFRFYRNADLDFSFAVRDAGWRAVRTEALPLIQHEHRGYTALPDRERDRLSKRNFYRFLDHWGDRADLLIDPSDD